VTYEVTDRIARIVLRRPDKLNALTPTMLADLQAAFHRLELDADADAAILSGDGRAFCSGADTAGHGLPPEERRARALVDPRRQLFEEGIEWKPIIAAPHGYAVGYGMVLALKCDLVVAEAGTRFQMSEIPRGLYASSLWALMAFRSSAAFADELTLTARFVAAEELLAHDAINAVAPSGEHLALAEDLARAVIGNPARAVRHAVQTRRAYQARFISDATLLTRAAPSPLDA